VTASPPKNSMPEVIVEATLLAILGHATWQCLGSTRYGNSKRRPS